MRKTLNPGTESAPRGSSLGAAARRLVVTGTPDMLRAFRRRLEGLGPVGPEGWLMIEDAAGPDDALLDTPSLRLLAATASDGGGGQADLPGLLASEQEPLRLLASAQERLREAGASHARFLATASHDLRQPIQILALLHGLAMRAPDPETTRNLLRQMEPMFAALPPLLDRLRDAAREEAPALAPEPSIFPMDPLLARMVGEFGPAFAARGLALRVMPCAEPIVSDPGLLVQILRQLLGHALDQGAHGRLVLGCRRHGAHLSIELHGAGLATAPGQGPARDLHRARRLAEQMLHRFDARAVPGRGARFAVEVPRALVPPPALLSAAPRTGTVLVVEDNAALRDLLVELLTMEGHHVVAVADGAAALDMAPGLTPPPAILLLEEELPGPQGGLALGRALRGIWGADLPVLILTEAATAEREAEIAAQGCLHLPKPVKPHGLANLVQSLLPAALLPEASPRPACAGSRLVYVVDDDPALCAALRAVLTEAGYAVRDYPSAEAFLAAYQRGGDACLLVDARLPGLSGLELLARLREAGDAIPSIMVTGFSDLPTAVLAMRRGAADFVTKPVRLRVLLEVLDRAMSRPLGSGNPSAARADAARRLASLTPRQREILDRVLAGQPSKNIAADLGISRRTVEVHRAAIMRQLKAKSLPALVRLVLTASGQEEAG